MKLKVYSQQPDYIRIKKMPLSFCTNEVSTEIFQKYFLCPTAVPVATPVASHFVHFVVMSANKFEHQ